MSDARTHWKSLTDTTYLGSWDLPKGRDVVVTIRKVESVKVRRTFRGDDKKAEEIRRPILFFEGKEKGIVLNSTNAKSMQAMYGAYVEGWVGKRVALYVTTTPAFGEVVDCIRIRPGVPK